MEFHCHDTWEELDFIQEGLNSKVSLMMTFMLIESWVTFHLTCLELMMKQTGIECCLCGLVLLFPDL